MGDDQEKLQQAQELFATKAALASALARAEAAEKEAAGLRAMSKEHLAAIRSHAKLFDRDEAVPLTVADLNSLLNTAAIYCAKAESAERALREATEPRDMSTAPRDGHRYLLKGDNRGVTWVAVGHYAPYDGCRWLSDDDKRLQNPTGWWPLPSAKDTVG